MTLPYAQHGTDGVTSTATAGASSVVSGEAPAPKVVPREGGAASTAPTQAVVKRTGSPLVWIVLAAVALTLTLLLAGPRLVRRQLRRRRVARAVKAGSAEPLWDELAASAVDLGVLWPDTVTVAQVPGWLGGHGLDERGALAVTAVADRLQRDRYAAPSGSSRGPAAARGAESWAPAEIIGFDEAIRRWGRQSERRRASLARWLPRSLITRRSSTRR